jgi:RHS repeat-associated protein
MRMRWTSAGRILAFLSVKAVLTSIVLALVAAPVVEAAESTPAPVSSLLVRLTLTRPAKFNPATNTFDSKATLTATGIPGPLIPSPVFVVITSVSNPVVQVANADGMMAPNLPYVVVRSTGLPNAPRSASVVIKFRDVTRQAFDFTAQAWAGPIRNPQITSTPAATGQVTVPYSYQVVASDPQNNPLTYSLPTAPAGMTIGTAGLVNWMPSASGTFPVRIMANNGHGGNVAQSYSIAVSALTVPDVVGLGQPDATKTLVSANLKPGTVAYQTSNTTPGGQVVSQNPAAGTVARLGTSVDLVVSLPPDPSSVAPQIDRSVASVVAKTTAFLHAGPNPIIQTGVAANTIAADQGAVIRGRVLDRGNLPLPGVVVTILNHPEFGQTVSRADGMFDMAVNGGGPLTLNYARPDLLTVHRQLIVPWQRYAVAPDVILVQPDNSTPIDLTSAAPVQVAQGSLVNDDNGQRRATLLFLHGTAATMTVPGGPAIPLTTLHVRATEFTIGSGGPQSMPAGLPPATGYTYAVEASVDEATTAGATSVKFSQQIPLYVDNFLNIPVGTPVPRGSYDRAGGAWNAANDGLVIKIVGVAANGLAEIAIDLSGNPASSSALAALGITDPERQALVGLYGIGQTLWRAGLDHFSAEDLNFSLVPPSDAVAYTGPSPKGSDALDDPTVCPGASIIEIENQVVGESVPIAGTPLTLNYRSNRVPGRKDAYQLTIPLSGASVPASLSEISFDVFVAGQHYAQSFPAPNCNVTNSCGLTNLVGQFTWDGNDAYGRKIQGVQPVVVRVTYTYPGHYAATGGAGGGFGRGGGGAAVIDPHPVDLTVNISSTFEASLGIWDERALGLGGWSLNVRHGYDVSGKALYLGDGSRRSAASKVLSAAINTYAGTGQHGFSGDNGQATAARIWLGADYSGLVAGPDGAIYLADAGNSVVRRIGPDGIITTVAGTGGQPGYSGDGGPAKTARLSNPTGLAFGPDGTLYVADAGNNVIRRMTPDGKIFLFAGAPGSFGDDGDDGPALAAHLKSPISLAFGPDGSLYVLDADADRVRRIGSNNKIYAFAGTGVSGPAPFSGSIPATQATLDLSGSSGVAVASDGSVYISDSNSFQVRRVGPDGMISRFAGASTEQGSQFPSGDGGPAILANVGFPTALAIGSDGALYISNTSTGGGSFDLVRRVGPDGIITTVAGGGAGPLGDGGPATSASLVGPSGLAVGPDGSLYVADGLSERIRRVTSMPGLQLSEFQIASDDGRRVYKFDGGGRHETTLDALTGGVLYTFAYDDVTGELKALIDGDNNQVTFNHDTSGQPVSIVSPFGQKTTLGVDSNGYLNQVIDPAGNTFSMVYSQDGLLQSFIDPNGNAASPKHGASMQYDVASGRLTNDIDSRQASTTLARMDNNVGSFTVAIADPLSRRTTYLTENQPTGKVRRLITRPDATQVEILTGTDGSRNTNMSDGTAVNLILGPDPRFSMQAPVPLSLTIARGPTGVINRERQAVWDLVNPSNNSQTDKGTVNDQPPFVRSFDGVSRAITNTSAEGRAITTSLDLQGRLTQLQTSGFASSITLSRNPGGRLASVTAAPSVATPSEPARVTAFGYGNDGFPNTITDALQNVWKLGFDSAGRLANRTLPDGSTIIYGRDPNGHVSSVTTPLGPVHGFMYTTDNLVSQYTPPMVQGSGPTRYEYYTDQRLKQVTRPDNKTITFAYDGTTGRLSVATIGRGNYTYDYDTASPATGHLVSIKAPDNGILTYGFQGPVLQTLTWSGTVTGSVSRALDANFRVGSISVNGSSPIAFAYDNDGLIKNAGALTVARSLPGKSAFITGKTVGNILEAITANDFGEIAATTATCTGSALGCVNPGLMTENYSYDRLGRVAQRNETILGGSLTTFEYHYDANGQLHEVRTNGVSSAVYTLDGNGNRQKVTRNGVDTIGTYDSQDRLSKYGAASYAYGPSGELLSKVDTAGTTSYNYDEFANLMSVTLQDGTLIEYVIDGRNRRIGKKVAGSLVQGLLYQGGIRPVAELDASNNVVSRFVYATNRNVPDYMVKDGVNYRIITDSGGSPRLVVDSVTGAVVQRLDYDEFGQVLQDTNPGFQPFGFAGGLYDRDTKLVRLGVRDYDPVTGRWTTKDPVKFKGFGTNLYSYAEQDPVNRMDPSGKAVDWNKWFKIGGEVLDAIDTWLNGPSPIPPPEPQAPVEIREFTSGGAGPDPKGGAGPDPELDIKDVTELPEEEVDAAADSAEMDQIVSDILESIRASLGLGIGSGVLPSIPQWFLECASNPETCGCGGRHAS